MGGEGASRERPAGSVARAKERKHASRILLVDLSPAIRRVVERMINQHLELEVAGKASDGLEAVVLAERTSADIVVMDLPLRQMGGLEAAEILKERRPETKIVIFTTSQKTDPEIEKLAELGADAYVSKHGNWEHLIDVLLAIHTGAPRPSFPGSKAPDDSKP